MLFKREKRTIPALNTTSTADISFMLLIFFLVTTSMDTDKGLTRQLPPLDDKKEEQTIDMDHNNVLILRLDEKDRLTADDDTLSLPELKARVMDFLIHCPDRKAHVISVESSREASYKAYFNMQNEIVGAYNELRNHRALKIYHQPFNRCNQQQQETLRAYYPQRVAEVYNTQFDEIDSQYEEGGEP